MAQACSQSTSRYGLRGRPPVVTQLARDLTRAYAESESQALSPYFWALGWQRCPRGGRWTASGRPGWLHRRGSWANRAPSSLTLCCCQLEISCFRIRGKWSESETHSVVPDSLQPHGTIQSMEFSRPEYWSGEPFPSPGDLPNPGTEPRSPALQVDSSPAELPGKSKNTGVGNFFLLQGIFPTQESNWGLLRWQAGSLPLSHQGSPVCVFIYS